MVVEAKSEQRISAKAHRTRFRIVSSTLEETLMETGKVPAKKELKGENDKGRVAPKRAKSVDAHGQNLKQNTRNQGYQQDR
jgi:hypothetical protein